MSVTTQDRYGKAQEVVEGIDNGVQPTLSVTLENGAEIIGTSQHRILMLNDALEMVWRRLDEVLPGGIAVRRVGDNLWATTPFLLPASPDCDAYGSVRNLVHITPPAVVTPEMGLFLGMLMSSGAVLETGVTLTSIDQEVREQFCTLASTLFNVSSYVRVDACENTPYVVINSRLLSRWLLQIGVPRYHDDNRIPNCILQSPRPVVEAFLRGYTLDGYFAVDSGWVHLCSTVSRRMAKDIASVLWNLGYDVCLRPKQECPLSLTDMDGDYRQHQFAVYVKREGAERFIEEIGFLEEWKNKTTREALQRSRSGGHESNSVPAAKIQAYYTSNRHRYTSERLQSVMETVPSLISVDILREFFSDVDFIAPLLDAKLRFTQVVEVVEGPTVPTFDVSIAVSHEYVANSVVVHNTLKYKPDIVPFHHFQEMVLKYQHQVRCCSVMPQEDTSSYEYLPEQRITEEEYHALKAGLVQNVFKKAEVKEEIGREHVDCGTGGACPIDFNSGSKV